MLEGITLVVGAVAFAAGYLLATHIHTIAAKAVATVNAATNTVSADITAALSNAAQSVSHAANAVSTVATAPSSLLPLTPSSTTLPKVTL